MQTFLPDADFVRSAQLLDQRRLGKQRVEALQVLRALTRETYGWKHHPAVTMWTGFEAALAEYGLVMCAEWTRRGFADTVADTIRADAAAAGVRLGRTQAQLDRARRLPPWLGDDDLHRSHRAALVRKDPDHYRPLFPDIDDDTIPYVWPGPSPRRAPSRRSA